jgi:formate-dependent nitrite reductase membrane component NrfD
MEDPIYWSWVIAVYLFVAGVSAGAFFISACAYLAGEKKYEPIIKWGAYIAPFPLIIGTLCLIYDLERPHLFWKLLFSFQPNSVMWIGTWILVFFSIFSFIHFYIWLPGQFDLGKIFLKLSERPKRFVLMRAVPFKTLARFLGKENFIRYKRLVAGLGIPFSICVGTYTGILLGVLNARPFWNSPILPLVFLLSALKTGTASISLTGNFSRRSSDSAREQMRGCNLFVQTFDFVLIVLFLIAIFLYIFGFYGSSATYLKAIQLIMGGEYTFSFWVLAIGLGTLFPLGFVTYELFSHFNEKMKSQKQKSWLVGLATSCVLVGGFVLRYVVVYAGQAV